MSYSVKPANIFGRLGEGFGKGLAEQLPKEIERNRLSSGLQAFEKESAGLDPMQRFTRLLSIPGVKDNPQLIQTLGELTKQQARNTNVPKGNPPASLLQQTAQPNQEGLAPSLTDEETFERNQQGYIPKAQPELIQEANKLFQESPGFYGNDINNAIEAAKEADLRNQEIASAYQKKYENLDTIQTNVVNRLKDQSNRLGVEIPSNVYSKVEDEAIQSAKPKKLGGEGLTEQQAMKKYGEKLDQISREYKNLDTLDAKFNTGPSTLLSTINSMQKQFDKRNDLENFADKLITNLDVSPLYAYSKAYPIEKNNDLNREIRKIPALTPAARSDIQKEFPKLFDRMTDKDSPLSVGYALQHKSYDANEWLDYARSRQDELKGWQIRQLSKPIYKFNPLNEYWIRAFGEK